MSLWFAASDLLVKAAVCEPLTRRKAILSLSFRLSAVLNCRQEGFRCEEFSVLQMTSVHNRGGAVVAE